MTTTGYLLEKGLLKDQTWSWDSQKKVLTSVQYRTLYSMQYNIANNESWFSPVDPDVRDSVCTACCTRCRPVRGECSTLIQILKYILQQDF